MPPNPPTYSPLTLIKTSQHLKFNAHAILPCSCHHPSLYNCYSNQPHNLHLSLQTHHHQPRPTNMKKSLTTMILSFLLLFSLVGFTLVSSDTPSSALQDQCSPDLGKLGECLSFATAKADAPTRACCSTVADIRHKDPVCLCFIIQMVHAGGTDVTSLGLQMERLIQLPSACKLADTKISNCPKLLNISPTSRDYAIFSNSTKASNSTTTLTSSTNKLASEGVMCQIHFLGTCAAVATAVILLSVF